MRTVGNIVEWLIGSLLIHVGINAKPGRPRHMQSSSSQQIIEAKDW